MDDTTSVPLSNLKRFVAPQQMRDQRVPLIATPAKAVRPIPFALPQANQTQKVLKGGKGRSLPPLVLTEPSDQLHPLDAIELCVMEIRAALNDLRKLRK
jgi:hypothetical protein